jgi:hypothetical protein
MAKQIWVANDRSQHDTEEDAVLRDIAVEVATIIGDTADQYGMVFNEDISTEALISVADVLISTDAWMKITEHLKKRFEKTSLKSRLLT